MVFCNFLCFFALFIFSIIVFGLFFDFLREGNGGFFDYLFAGFCLLLAGTGCILMPICCVYGLIGEVHFELKNSDGIVINKTVAPFEYTKDGNCFRFVDSDTTYCGWEVMYE